MKLQYTKSGQFFINLSKEKVMRLGWRSGDTIDLNITSEGQSIILTKIKLMEV